jgi:hypothetical protein
MNSNFDHFEFIAICEPYLSLYHLSAVPQYIVAALWPQKSLSMNILLCNLQFSVIITTLGTECNKNKELKNAILGLPNLQFLALMP